MTKDVRLAIRTLGRERGTTLVAVLSLAIGLAANTTIFSLVQAVEFPQLIYPSPDRLVFFESDHAGRGLRGMPVSAPDAADFLTSARTIGTYAIAGDQSSVLDAGDGPRRVGGRRVTPGFFETFGVAPSIGRTLGRDEAPGTIVIGHDLWTAAFGSDPNVAGRTVRLDGGTVTVAGVMPRGFDTDADFWTPLSSPPHEFPRDDRQFSAFARLGSGATLGDLTAEATSIASTLARDHRATNEGWTLTAAPLSRMHGRDSRGAFLMLQGAVMVMLLIVCANVANILLARGTKRRHEMALRLSLGATRRRLIQQLLTESILLAGAGAVLGVGLSLWGVRAARALGGFPSTIEPTVNPLVLGFSLVLAVLTGVLCGIIPALRASAANPEDTLRREGGRGASGTRGHGRDALVAIQVTGAVVLATCGSLMLQSWLHRQQVDLGFDPRGAFRADVNDVAPDTVARLLERLSSDPNVDAAGAQTFALATGAGTQRVVARQDDVNRALDPSVRRGFDAVSPGYFRALGIPLRRGRVFEAGDSAGALPVAIINDELARHLFPDTPAIGALLRLGRIDEAAPVVQVVGVVGNTRRSAMHDIPVARVFLPLSQHPNRYQIQIVARARTTGASVPAVLTAAARDVDRSLLLERVRSLETDVAQFAAPMRLMTTLLTGFGVTGLLLAALGVFGTTSYVTSLRSRELALRSALGATRRDIVRLVIRTGLTPTLWGLSIGLVLAVLSARAIATFLFGVQPGDWPTLAGVAMLLTTVTLLACYRPARAAATVDPMTILRRE